MLGARLRSLMPMFLEPFNNRGDSMRSIIILLSAATLLAASPPPQFPRDMRDAWAKTASLCEPEFTGGFKIGRDKISYYEGIDQLTNISLAKTVQTPFGKGRSYIAKLRWKFHDESSTSFNRFTIVGNAIYRSDSKDVMSKHLRVQNRLRRCPPGSTGS